MKNKNLIAVIGPTAIGKTSLAIDVARHYKCPVLSADSRQVYREMKIGTAVPSPDELDAAPHHFIQHKSIHDNYSAGDFEKEALAKLRELFKDNDKVVLVGGSGLYLKAVCEGLDYFPEIQKTTRENLNREYRDKGLTPLCDELAEVDPMSYQKVDRSNPQRVIRALEVFRESGETYSSFLNQPKAGRFFETLKIGLTAERQVIYDRIEQRVDLMMEDGLLNEAEELYPYRHIQALNTVGYKELFSYFDGDIELQKAVDAIKTHTRRFAKRQLTWFRKDKSIHWFEQPVELEEILTTIKTRTED